MRRGLLCTCLWESIWNIYTDICLTLGVGKMSASAMTTTSPGDSLTTVTHGSEREMFYLTTHSTHFIYGYMASDIWLRTILIVRKETRCRHIGYSYRLTARVLLHGPSHRQDNTYHGLCYTSRGALAGPRNSSMGQPHEGSIRRPIAPWANALPLSYVPLPAWKQWNVAQHAVECSATHAAVSEEVVKVSGVCGVWVCGVWVWGVCLGGGFLRCTHWFSASHSCSVGFKPSDRWW